MFNGDDKAAIVLSNKPVIATATVLRDNMHAASKGTSSIVSRKSEWDSHSNAPKDMTTHVPLSASRFVKLRLCEHSDQRP